MLEDFIRKIKKNLESNPNIIGKEKKYMNASVFIPLIEIDNEVHVLYQVRSEHIRQGGEIGFPGGMVEKVDQAITRKQPLGKL